MNDDLRSGFALVWAFLAALATVGIVALWWAFS